MLENPSRPTEETPSRAGSFVVALAADHAGLELKERIREELGRLGIQTLDLGAHSLDPADDYPDYAERVGERISQRLCDRAIVVCGSGVGVGVALNKFPGVRAAVCHDAYSARQGVEHDDMNVLCLGSRVVGVELALDIVRVFLRARFTGEERHRRRLEKVLAIEKRHLGNSRGKEP